MVTSKIKWSIAIAIGVFYLWGSGIAAAAPPIIPVGERKFDHSQHEKSAAASGDAKRSKAECADCHKQDAKGVRTTTGGEHATRCIKCHDNPKTCPEVQKFPGTPKNPARRCDTCHLPTGTCKLPAIPPKPTSDSFQARFAHGEHIGFKVAIEQQCAQCHPGNAPAGTQLVVAHTLCTPCHASGTGGVSIAKLRFNNCQGCHQAPRPKTGPSGDPFRLAKFDEAAHRKHHTDSRQASCTTCHAKMSGTSKDDVPRPAMAACLGACHDGTPGKAFSAVGTSCTRCHKNNGGGITVALPKEQVFSHSKHIQRNVKIDQSTCQNCHSLKDDGQVEAPNVGKNHMPCAASGCHQTEFLSKTVKICGVCHDKANPWEKTLARLNEGTKPEYFPVMNHTAHLQKKGVTNAACTDCHGDKLGGGKEPKGHQACIECHGKGPPAHNMNECGKCHSQTQTQHPTTQWSVSQTFVHTKHAQDPRSRKATNCIDCHKDVGKSKSLAEVARPKMESCADCHNGKNSFKATGFECARCHTPPKQVSTPAALRSFTPKGTEQAMLDTPRQGEVR